jgi:integrase
MTAFPAPEQANVVSDDRVLRAAVAAYLGRYRGQSRLHTGSDLHIFLTWCTGQGLDPLRVGKGDKTVLIPLPPAVARAIDRAVDGREHGPILRNTYSVRMDRHAATRRLKYLAGAAGVRMPRMHPHLLRHTFVTTMLDAGVSLRDVQIAARHADPRTTMRYDRARKTLDRHPNYILAAYMASGT